MSQLKARQVLEGGARERVSESEELREARDRAERAERELEALKNSGTSAPEAPKAQRVEQDQVGGEEMNERPEWDRELRKDSMMAHLLDSLEQGKDIGHYGRLVIAMIARHFMSDEEVIAWLTKDRDFSEEAAVLMLRQVEGRDYNPPRKERIVAWQKEQDFAILPHADDPDCGNVYRTLKFPDGVYEHIQEYQVEKMEAAG